MFSCWFRGVSEILFELCIVNLLLLWYNIWNEIFTQEKLYE